MFLSLILLSVSKSCYVHSLIIMFVILLHTVQETSYSMNIRHFNCITNRVNDLIGSGQDIFLDINLNTKGKGKYLS